MKPKRIVYHWPKILKVAAGPGDMIHTHDFPSPPNLFEWCHHPPFCSSQKPETHPWVFLLPFLPPTHPKSNPSASAISKYVLNLSTFLPLHCRYPGPNHHHLSPRILQYFSRWIPSCYPITYSPIKQPGWSFKNQVWPFILMLKKSPVPHHWA